MKLFIAAHFLILSFVALAIGIWKNHLIISIVIFIILQAIGIYVIFKNEKQGADNV